MQATWQVPLDLPAFDGHFDGHPIVPGVVLLDQALLRAQNLASRGDLLWSVTQTKFLSPVGPGELLTFQFDMTSVSVIRFEILAGDRLVASGAFATHTP